MKGETFPVFARVVRGMPSGKAVGECGFSIELLRAADEWVLRAFYRALLKDLADSTLSSDWSVVLYALLLKPLPNNASLVCGRREIALMAQDLKVFLHMVRSLAYQQIQCRIVPEQLGWAAGYSTGDIGLSICCVIQQARRLQMPLYLLYMDLAQFFSLIDREIGTVVEILHGLPLDVAWLACMIYGGFDGKPPVQCRLDTAAGLSSPFAVWVGWLMGCVLSPDKAKIFLNSCLIAQRISLNGVPLFGYSGTVGENSMGEGPSMPQAVETWKSIKQLVFGDDWVGLCVSAEQVQRGWYRWTVWAEMVNAKIGVKLNKRRKPIKTALAGVVWSANGKALCAPDPRLQLPDGSYVPMLSVDDFYVHVGVCRRVDGLDTDARKQVKDKLLYAVR